MKWTKLPNKTNYEKYEKWKKCTKNVQKAQNICINERKETKNERNVINYWTKRNMKNEKMCKNTKWMHEWKETKNERNLKTKPQNKCIMIYVRNEKNELNDRNVKNVKNLTDLLHQWFAGVNTIFTSELESFLTSSIRIFIYSDIFKNKF